MKHSILCVIVLFFLTINTTVISAEFNPTSSHLTHDSSQKQRVSNTLSLSNKNIQITDYTGKKITRRQPTKRLIALAPHIVENIFSAGLGHQLVGAVSHSDYPEAAKKYPSLGTIMATV